MYTWGYIIGAALAKLDLDDLDENETTVQIMLSRFPYFANEAMTQICSIKPKRTFAEFDITEINVTKTMPDDFISFGDDVNTRQWKDFVNDIWLTEVHDDEMRYEGYNKLQFFATGKYKISYNARWHKFDTTTDENVTIDAPVDVLECLPSYIASQCYKVDDETKSAIYRNEYEMFLSRLDDTDYKNTKTFKIGGDW